MKDGRLDDWNVDDAELLGSGGEAEVYILDDELVVRVYRDSSDQTFENALRRASLMDEIAHGGPQLSFATPVVVETLRNRVGLVQIEHRLEGESVLTALETAEGVVRTRLVQSYLDAALQLGHVHIEREFFGEIGRVDAVQTQSWQEFLTERARRSLSSSPLSYLDAEPVAAGVGAPISARGLVHLDYFAGNVMSKDERVSAVIDFGYSTIIGDTRLNAVCAVAHLVAKGVTPSNRVCDYDVAVDWLEDRGLRSYYDRALPWLAAYWTFAHDDAEILAWCRSILE